MDDEIEIENMNQKGMSTKNLWRLLVSILLLTQSLAKSETFLSNSSSDLLSPVTVPTKDPPASLDSGGVTPATGGANTVGDGTDSAIEGSTDPNAPPVPADSSTTPPADATADATAPTPESLAKTEEKSSHGHKEAVGVAIGAAVAGTVIAGALVGGGIYALHKHRTKQYAKTAGPKPVVQTASTSTQTNTHTSQMAVGSDQELSHITPHQKEHFLQKQRNHREAFSSSPPPKRPPPPIPKRQNIYDAPISHQHHQHHQLINRGYESISSYQTPTSKLGPPPPPPKLNQYKTQTSHNPTIPKASNQMHSQKVKKTKKHVKKGKNNNGFTTIKNYKASKNQQDINKFMGRNYTPLNVYLRVYEDDLEYVRAIKTKGYFQLLGLHKQEEALLKSHKKLVGRKPEAEVLAGKNGDRLKQIYTQRRQVRNKQSEVVKKYKNEIHNQRMVMGDDQDSTDEEESALKHAHHPLGEAQIKAQTEQFQNLEKIEPEKMIMNLQQEHKGKNKPIPFKECQQMMQMLLVASQSDMRYTKFLVLMEMEAVYEKKCHKRHRIRLRSMDRYRQKKIKAITHQRAQHEIKILSCLQNTFSSILNKPNRQSCLAAKSEVSGRACDAQPFTINTVLRSIIQLYDGQCGKAHSLGSLNKQILNLDCSKQHSTSKSQISNSDEQVLLNPIPSQERGNSHEEYQMISSRSESHGEYPVAHPANKRPTFEGSESSFEEDEENHNQHADQNHNQHADQNHNQRADQNHNQRADQNHNQRADQNHNQRADQNHNQHADQNHNQHADQNHNQHHNDPKQIKPAHGHLHPPEPQTDQDDSTFKKTMLHAELHRLSKRVNQNRVLLKGKDCWPLGWVLANYISQHPNEIEFNPAKDLLNLYQKHCHKRYPDLLHVDQMAWAPIKIPLSGEQSVYLHQKIEEDGSFHVKDGLLWKPVHYLEDQPCGHCMYRVRDGVIQKKSPTRTPGWIYLCEIDMNLQFRLRKMVKSQGFSESIFTRVQ